MKAQGKEDKSSLKRGKLHANAKRKREETVQVNQNKQKIYNEGLYTRIYNERIKTILRNEGWQPQETQKSTNTFTFKILG